MSLLYMYNCTLNNVNSACGEERIIILEYIIHCIHVQRIFIGAGGVKCSVSLIY